MSDALSCFIIDDRLTAPTLAFLVGADAEAAQRFAAADLCANPHHLAVEVRDGEALLFVVRREDLAASDGAGRGAHG
jgi:hypothetical protein